MKDLLKGALFPKPVVENNRCLRSGLGRSGCTACRDVCPAPGFHLNGATVALPGDCISCHLCTAACPEGAIRGILPPPRLLNQTVIGLRCERVYRYGVAPIACVGAIPKAFLEVASIRKRSVHLVTGPCERCELCLGLTLCEQRIARVHETHSLTWHRSEQPFSEVPERRRLLAWLGRSFMPYRMKATDYRELLPAELISDADRIRPVLTDRCVGCPVCEVVCPHHVFHRDETDTGVSYWVVEQRCTGCRKCMDSCPFRGVMLESASQRSVRRVVLGRQKCPDCQEVFVGKPGACPRCIMIGTQGLLATTGSARSAVGVRRDDRNKS